MEEMTDQLKKLLEETQEIVNSKGLPFMTVMDPETGKHYIVYSKKTAQRRGTEDYACRPSLLRKIQQRDIIMGKMKRGK